jgi:hypothetical protein
MRTARSRTAGEKRFDFLLMTPSSQSLEPPQKSERFTNPLLIGGEFFAPKLGLSSPRGC